MASLEQRISTTVVRVTLKGDFTRCFGLLDVHTMLDTSGFELGIDATESKTEISFTTSYEDEKLFKELLDTLEKTNGVTHVEFATPMSAG